MIAIVEFGQPEIRKSHAGEAAGYREALAAETGARPKGAGTGQISRLGKRDRSETSEVEKIQKIGKQVPGDRRKQ